MQCTSVLPLGVLGGEAGASTSAFPPPAFAFGVVWRCGGPGWCKHFSLSSPPSCCCCGALSRSVAAVSAYSHPWMPILRWGSSVELEISVDSGSLPCVTSDPHFPPGLALGGAWRWVGELVRTLQLCAPGLCSRGCLSVGGFCRCKHFGSFQVGTLFWLRYPASAVSDPGAMHMIDGGTGAKRDLNPIFQALTAAQMRWVC